MAKKKKSADFVAGEKGQDEICRVDRVDPGSPASVANLVPGDVVLSIDGTPIMSAQRAIKLIRESKGSNVTFNVLRQEIVEEMDDSS